MKICLVTHCFYPSKLRGGPTVSMNNMAKAIAPCADVHIITIGNEADGKQYTQVRMGHNTVFGCDVNYLTENTPRAFYRALSEVKPDVIYISSLFSWQYSLSALYYANLHHVRVILAPRGELMPAALSIKKERKMIFLGAIKAAGMDRHVDLHATAEEECNQAGKFFPHAKVWFVRNLPTVPDAFHKEICKQFGSLRIVIAGRIHPIKNVDLALKMLRNVRGKIDVDIYGAEEVEDYLQRCKTIAKSLPEHIKIRFHGVIDHDDIPKIMENHDLLLSPTQSENFGQSIVEALLNGTPVVISNNTPWHGLERRFAGFDISLDCPQDFTGAIQRFVDMGPTEYEQWSIGARQYIREEIQVDSDIAKYRQMFQIEK